jgi:hypothetical protein
LQSVSTKGTGQGNARTRRWTAPFRVLAQIILAPIVLFEEWGWEPLQRGFGWLVRHSPLRAVERGIAALPPYGALVTYATPTIGLLPVKLVALKLIALGHPVMGLAIIGGAKVVGTAIVARLFHLTKPQLLRIPWFLRLYSWWLPWKTAIVDAVNAFALVRASKTLAAGIRKTITGWFRRRR